MTGSVRLYIVRSQVTYVALIPDDMRQYQPPNQDSSYDRIVRLIEMAELPSTSAAQRIHILSLTREIESMQDGSIRLWKSRFNALTITVRIPPEVLARIFEVFAAEDHEEWLPTRVFITHVCSHWRLVALHCPAFWSYVNFQSKWNAEMISHSRSAPLIIIARVGGGICNVKQVYNVLSTDFYRVQSLYLHHQPGYKNQANVNNLLLFRQPAPMLEYFNFEASSWKDLPSLSRQLFQGVAPRLRHLEFRYCGVSFHPPILPPGLQTITTLTFVHFPESGKTSIYAVLSMLNELPVLERLVLIDVLAGASSIQLRSVPGVHLPRLNYIKVEQADCTSATTSSGNCEDRDIAI
ncbi:hypothetical protein H0H81_007955 [Sphagnurus paluster]|uniref:F-box domain-containing protein n=1 Tax=Sphagnurus paluster TaxID=117069 RepID=A0A9P7KKE3_9AGAR|nr:hypothetical protein H0H81_007955 [Sphagnurus paluster]